MCTLIVLHRCFDDVPLLVAANRDEFLDRPAEPPALRHWGGRRVLAPRDLEAGGTWLGLNDSGLFAAITNRPTAHKDTGRRSRGLVVADALAEADAARAAQRLLQLPPDSYNPFNVLVSDGREAFAIVYEEKPVVSRLEPGAHVIGNADPDAADVPKVARLLARAQRIARGPGSEALEALADLCRRHEAAASPLEDACIHAGGYGTRCSTLLRRGAGEGDAFLFAAGPPCEAPYEDMTPLLAELDRETRIRPEGTARNP